MIKSLLQSWAMFGSLGGEGGWGKGLRKGKGKEG